MLASKCSFITDIQHVAIDGRVYELNFNFHKCRTNNINLTIVLMFLLIKAAYLEVTFYLPIEITLTLLP